jgi:hypothetical protein
LGAGSTVFARNVLGDCLHVPALQDAEIALIDIDAERLGVSEMMVKNLARNLGAAAQVRSYLAADAATALAGADYVVNASRWAATSPPQWSISSAQEVRPAPDHRRYSGHRRHLSRPAHHPRDVELLPHHGGGGAPCAVAQL